MAFMGLVHERLVWTGIEHLVRELDVLHSIMDLYFTTTHSADDEYVQSVAAKTNCTRKSLRAVVDEVEHAAKCQGRCRVFAALNETRRKRNRCLGCSGESARFSHLMSVIRDFMTAKRL